jgi:hypothetical protein
VLILRRFKFDVASLLVFWGLAVGSGIVFLGVHSSRPGNAGTPPLQWPEGSLIRRVGGRPTLLMFLHPGCPCSRASLAELAQIMSVGNGRVSAHALLCLPAQVPQRWGESTIEQDLAELPDVVARQDPGGSEARRFGVVTSGHVLLYDARGRLTFSGGIMSARGHRGDNYGRDAVLARIMGREGNRPLTPVFGCALNAAQPPDIEERPR